MQGERKEMTPTANDVVIKKKKKPNIEKENEHSALERALQVWA